MSEPPGGRDYSELLRSPYDPDPERPEGESALPWKVPVIAAVLGALSVGVFVLWSLSGGPTDDGEPVAATTTTVPTQASDPVPADDYPPGYAEVIEGVGARAERLAVSDVGTVVAVSTVVQGGRNPLELDRLNVALWVLELDDGPKDMLRQYGQTGSLGNITVEFPTDLTPRGARLAAYPATSVESVSVSLDLGAEMPVEVANHRVDLGGGSTLVIDRLVVDDGWGFIEWRLEGDATATVSTVVTFSGTDDPLTEGIDHTLLTSPHLRAQVQGSGITPEPPLFGRTGSEALERSGEPLSETNRPETISVQFMIELAQVADTPIILEILASG